MINRNPEDRPTATAVRYYPAFWDSSTLLSFLQVFIYLKHIHLLGNSIYPIF